MKLTNLAAVAEISKLRERYQNDLELFQEDTTTVYITGQHKDLPKSFIKNAVVRPIEGDMLAELLKVSAITYLKDAIKQLETELKELGVAINED